jgi:WD40 repeat protein
MEELAVWDAATGKKRFSTGRSFMFAFSPDSKSLAVLRNTPDTATLTVHDAITGKVRFTCEVPTLASPVDSPDGVAYSPNGKLLAVCAKRLTLIDADTGKRRASLGEGRFSPVGLRFSPDGKLVATMEGDLAPQPKDKKVEPQPEEKVDNERGGEIAPPETVVRVWDIEAAKKKFEARAHDHITLVPVFSRDAGVLITAGSDAPSKSDPTGALTGRIRFWRLDTGKPCGAITAHRGGITCLELAPDGETLASGGNDGLVIVWKPGKTDDR